MFKRIGAVSFQIIIAYGPVEQLRELKERTHTINKDNVIEMEELIPRVYLKGICTGDFREAVAAVGKKTPSSSASTNSRLKAVWEEKPKKWQKRDLSPQLDCFYFSMSTSLKKGVATGVGS